MGTIVRAIWGHNIQYMLCQVHVAWFRTKGLYFLPRRPKRPCPLVVPAMTAAFLDENLPDGTRLRPGTKFIKYWKMRNTGTISWSADTKVKKSTVLLLAEIYLCSDFMESAGWSRRYLVPEVEVYTGHKRKKWMDCSSSGNHGRAWLKSGKSAT